MILLSAAGIALAGCALFMPAQSRKFNSLAVGMNKAAVAEIMGQPFTVSANGKIEYLRYRLTEPGPTIRGWYFVRLVDGKVDAFGREGDFDSVKPQEATVNLHLRKPQDDEK